MKNILQKLEHIRANVFKHALISFLLAIPLEIPQAGASVAASHQIASNDGVPTFKSLGLTIVKPLKFMSAAEKEPEVYDAETLKSLNMTQDEFIQREYELRELAADTLLDIYFQINRNTISIDASLEKKNYVIPGNNWQSITGTNYEYLVPVLDRDLSKALDDIRGKEKYHCDCTIASGFAIYALIEKFFPESKNEFLKSTRIKHVQEKRELRRAELQSQGRPFFVDDYKQQLAMELAKGHTMEPLQEGARGIKPGDHIYFEGHPQYLAVHPAGTFRGEYLFFVGYNLKGLKMYIGCGELFAKGPKTAQEIQKNLAEKYLKGMTFSGEEARNKELESAYQLIRGILPTNSKLSVAIILDLQKP